MAALVNEGPAMTGARQVLIRTDTFFLAHCSVALFSYNFCIRIILLGNSAILAPLVS
jgi:hypothetical protein